MLDITLDELKIVLGDPTKIAGHQYYFRCPACTQGGGDTHGDNLLFNSNKKLLKCFACDDGAQLTLQMINEYRRDNHIVPIKQETNKPIAQRKLWWKENLDNLASYWLQSMEEMTNEARQWLHQKHGISNLAIDNCGIGFDSEPNILKIGASVTFPIIAPKYDMNIVGFELRQIGEEKIIKHTLDAPSCMSRVWGINLPVNYAIICEGFKDAYNMYSLLYQKFGDGVYNWHIFTPAHGAKDVLANITDIDWTAYKKCYLLLDNDPTGDETTKAIINQYPFFTDKRSLIQPYNDVSDYWMAQCN